MILAAGLTLIVCAVLFFISEYVNKTGRIPSLEDVIEGESPVSVRPAMLSVVLGALLSLFGIAAVLVGEEFSDGGRGYLLLAILWLWTAIQARLILYGVRNYSENFAGRNRGNIFETMRMAFSIGFFPKGGFLIVFLIKVFETLAVFSLLGYLFSWRV